MHEPSTTPAERTMARKLVRAMLREGGVITVNNGGDDDEITDSHDPSAILATIGETGEDRISARTPEGKRLGSFLLIWGNDPEGTELVADHTDNAWCGAIMGAIQKGAR